MLKKSKHERGLERISQPKRLTDYAPAPPLWIRAPVKGPEYWSGFSRSKLYELDKKGKIRSVKRHSPF